MNLLVALGTALLSLASPPPARIAHDIPYAAHDRGALDIYFPRRPAPGHPIALFIYGGSWQSGSKSMYGFVGRALAARGIVTVIADYRVYPEARYPLFLQDNAEAAAFVKQQAAAWGADPRRFYLIGHSAGAYDVAMLGLDRRWLAAVGLDPKRDIAGVIGLAGPYDFLPLRDATLKIIFGPEDERPATQPIAYVSADAPPFFVAAGSGDTVVDPGNTTRLATALSEKGGEVDAHIYPRMGHVGAVLALVAPFNGKAPLLDGMLAFMKIPSSRAESQDAQNAPPAGVYAQ